MVQFTQISLDTSMNWNNFLISQCKHTTQKYQHHPIIEIEAPVITEISAAMLDKTPGIKSI